jgi:hypothetical protein
LPAKEQFKKRSDRKLIRNFFISMIVGKFNDHGGNLKILMVNKYISQEGFLAYSIIFENL